MQYRRLGESGLMVSRLAFGAMTFSAGNRSLPGVYKIEESIADRLVGQAVDAGVNFFDTADVYALGESEAILGRALKARSEESIVATKVGGRHGKRLNEAGLSRRNIMASLDASLRRLGRDWIDLYIVHRDDPYTPMEETLTALDDVVRAGKVRYLGFSNWSAWRVVTAMEMMKANNLAPFTHGQMYYSLVGRDIEHDVIPMMRQYGLGLTVWSPLAGGFLTGKYPRGATPEADARYAAFDMMPLDADMGYRLIDLMRPIADAHGASLAQVGLAWLLTRDAVSSVILGAAKPEQLADNLKAASLELTAEEIAALDAESERDKPYPNWFIERFGDRRTAVALGHADAKGMDRFTS